MVDRRDFVNQLANAGVHFLVLTAFWTVLYKKLAEDIAREALKDQVNSAVQSAAAKIDASFPSMQILHHSVDTGITPTTTLSPPSQKKNQKYLYYLFTIMTSIAGGLYLLNSRNRNQIAWAKILRDNMILFAGIGAIEYWFFMKIARYYAPILPSDLVENTKERVLEYGHCQ